MTLAMRMLLAGLLLVLAATAGATAQVPDRAFIEGRDDALDTNPLESQLRDRPRFPASAAFLAIASSDESMRRHAGFLRHLGNAGLQLVRKADGGGAHELPRWITDSGPK